MVAFIFAIRTGCLIMAVSVLDLLLCIAQGSLCSTGVLFVESFDLLFFVADDYSNFLLYLTHKAFYRTINLIFVHFQILHLS